MPWFSMVKTYRVPYWAVIGYAVPVMLNSAKS